LSIWLEYNDTSNISLTLYNLVQLWQASHDASIVECVASLLKVSQAEAEELLQKFISGA
jgi:hypothetical protein